MSEPEVPTSGKLDFDDEVAFVSGAAGGIGHGGQTTSERASQKRWVGVLHARAEHVA
ncbi:hypothetical protein SAMN05216559_0828 [Halomicrobium zhouii]|uniref:Uncharacterized protein n=1 Tax=Halomicrobium zhouii TaxID=767519 RepID=A0A1I6KHL0_9EURY|nr:hypothetical protein [Halomicrobium zhouii]SFR90725.1 hypothetical protein SAMN05216559_0828 [Halomicrobium zhouii]